MNKYVILCDSSCDLTEDLRKRFEIEDYMPGQIIFPDGHSEPSDLDWREMSAVDFYTSMSKKVLYKTSQPSLGDQMAFFEKYLKQGYDILNVSLSSALSGTYSNCCVAARELKKTYPDRKIICVDSLRYSGAYGLLLSVAGEMRKGGKPMEEVAKWIEDNRSCVRQMGTVDDMFFLKNMGRVSGMTALMGSLVNIKPMADVDETGMNKIIGKTTGYKKAYAVVLEYMRRTIVNPHEQRIFVSCTNRRAQALQLKAMIEEQIQPKEIIMTTVSKSCGAAIGPGMMVAFYFGKPGSPQLEEETKIMQEILK